MLMKLKLNLLFNDLAHRFGNSKGLASRMYNSWMPVLDIGFLLENKNIRGRKSSLRYM
jgi:hypothetical protein